MNDLTPEAVNQALKVDLEIVLQYEGDTREIEAFHVLKEAARMYADPDYEAARQAMIRQIECGDGDFDVKWIVDAALRVTEEPVSEQSATHRPQLTYTIPDHEPEEDE